MLAHELHGMTTPGILAMAFALGLVLAPGGPLPCAAARSKSEACLPSFDSCVGPCPARCRARFPASWWAWWREGEFSECVEGCRQACVDHKKQCEQRRPGVR